jgi:hypothetical protein
MKRPLLPPPPPPAPSTVVNVVPRTPLMTPAPPPAAEDPFGQLGPADQGKVAPIPPPSDAPAKSKPRAFDWKLVALIAMTGYAVLVTGLAAWGWLRTPTAHETTPAKKAK